MGKQKEVESSEEDDKMEVEEPVRKVKRVKRILKARESKIQSATTGEKKNKKVKNDKKKSTNKPLKLQLDEKKQKIFSQLKQNRQEQPNQSQGKINKGKRRRLEKKKKLEFRKMLNDKIGQKKKTLSVDELQTALNSIPKNESLKIKQAPTIAEKSRAVNSEVDRMRQILNYAQFQKNPLGSIKTHLLNDLKMQKKL